jgi:hypothetical protein
MGNDKGGRPRIIDTPEEFEEKTAAYFQELDRENAERATEGFGPRPPTITGLCLFLGFADRQSFYDYANEPGFSCAVRKARARIEQHHEERMSGNSPTGSIFWLKNHDWTDKQETDHRFPDGIPAARVDWGEGDDE